MNFRMLIRLEQCCYVHWTAMAQTCPATGVHMYQSYGRADSSYQSTSKTDGLVCYYCSKPKIPLCIIRIVAQDTFGENQNFKRKLDSCKKNLNFVGPCFAGQGTRRLLVSGRFIVRSCNMYRHLCRTKPGPSSHSVPSHCINKSMVRKDTDDYANLAKAFF